MTTRLTTKTAAGEDRSTRPSPSPERSTATVKATGERLTRGLRAVEDARQAHRAVCASDRPEGPSRYSVTTAQRSPQELKRIKALPDTVGVIGDGGPLARRPKIGALDNTDRVELPVSKVPAALYLKDLTLNRSFNTFRRTNQIYLAAIAWDLSGTPPRVFPPAEAVKAAPMQATYAMKPNETLKFVGDGLQLWPQQSVEGGLFVQLVVMESDSDVRKLGDKLESVRQAVETSELTQLLTVLAGGATGGTVVAVQQAGLALSKVVEGLLKKNDDDLVAVYHGTYGAEGIDASRQERYDRRGASITLNLQTPERPDAQSPR